MSTLTLIRLQTCSSWLCLVEQTLLFAIPYYLIKRLQRVQLAAAGFVMGCFADMADILALGWLPVAERRDFNLSKLIFKALHEEQCPSYLKLEMYTPNRTLRSSSERKLTVHFKLVAQKCTMTCLKKLNYGTT